MAEKLGRPLLYTYGIADMFFVMLTSMELYFFAAFLTDYAGFSLGIVGNILVITSLGDIVCALAGGIILQKVTLRFGGKYRSWFLVGPLMFLPLSVLQFTKIGTDLIAGAIIIFGFVTSHLRITNRTLPPETEANLSGKSWDWSSKTRPCSV